MPGLKSKFWTDSTGYSFDNNTFTKMYFSKKKGLTHKMPDTFATVLSIAWQFDKFSFLSLFQRCSAVQIESLF